MITVMCSKWGDKYGPEHVNILKSMVKRHLHMDYRFVCVTDDPEGLDCDTLHINDVMPSWETCRDGCFRRLDLFRPEVSKFLGKRFVSIDVDCVILSDITPLFERGEDFVIWKHPVHRDRYCGSMFMMTAGARPHLAKVKREGNRKFAGTDQAVMADVLGPNEATWDENDGIFTKLLIRRHLPSNARIVFYPGNRDPSTDRDSWAVRNWK